MHNNNKSKDSEISHKEYCSMNSNIESEDSEILWDKYLPMIDNNNESEDS